MKQFQYTITDPMGLHARPAGVIVVVIFCVTPELRIGQICNRGAGTPARNTYICSELNHTA